MTYSGVVGNDAAAGATVVVEAGSTIATAAGTVFDAGAATRIRRSNGRSGAK